MISDYNSISLIGCIYGIICKILSLKMKKVMGHCIDKVQSAYVEGRNILGKPLVVNEICSWEKNTKKNILLLKLDFDKAFE